MTPEEIRKFKERYDRGELQSAPAPTTEEAPVVDAPAGATEDQSFFLRPNISPTSAALEGAGNMLTGGALPQVKSLLDVAAGHGMQGLDRLGEAAGLPEDLMQPGAPPTLNEAWEENKEYQNVLRERHSWMFGGGEAAGAFNPLTKAANVAIQGIPKAWQRIAATMGGTALGEGAYTATSNATTGGDTGDILENAVSGAAIAGPFQGLTELASRGIRSASQDPASGAARALDDVYHKEVLGANRTPSAIRAEGERLGPGATAADISGGLARAPAQHKVDVASIPNFYDYMRGRQEDIPGQIAQRTKQQFGFSLPPGRVRDGIDDYRRTVMEPQYTQVLSDMNDSGVTVPARDLVDDLENVIRGPDDDIGIYDDVVTAIRRPLTQSARNLAERNGVAIPEDATALDVVEFTPSQLHNIKKRIDREIEKVPFEQRTKRRALAQARRHVSEFLSDLSPDYAALNSRFAGTATAHEAYENGRKMLLRSDTDPRDFADLADNMSPGDAPFFMEGINHAITQKLTKADDVKSARAVLKDEGLKNRLRAAIGDEAADTYLRDIENSLIKLDTAKEAVPDFEKKLAEEYGASVNKARTNVADMGIIGGVMANAMMGKPFGGAGSLAAFGAARRTIGNMFGRQGDAAKALALSDIALMEPQEFAQLIQNLPEASRLAVPGSVRGSMAASSLMGPIFEEEEIRAAPGNVQQSIMDMFQ